MAGHCSITKMTLGLPFTVMYIFSLPPLLSHTTTYHGCCQGLNSFPVDIPANTTTLFLEENDIHSLPIIADILPIVERCYLYNNTITHIRRVTFSGLTKLWVLHLQYNPLVLIEFPTHVPSLTQIYVDIILPVIEASQLSVDDGTLLYHEGSCETGDVHCWILIEDRGYLLRYGSCNAGQIQIYSSQLVCLKGKINKFLFTS